MARVTRVVIRPLSGYINRIQAVASAYLLAQDLDSELAVSWVPEQVSPALPQEIFAQDFMKELSFGAEFGAVAPYLNFDPGRKIISLAGLDKGEQFFMGELIELIKSITGEVEIHISAGGKYSLDSVGFDQRRKDFYQHTLRFVNQIEDAALSTAKRNEPYIALHLRYSDRSHQAPTRNQIERTMSTVSASTHVNSLFIASDSLAEREYWYTRSKKIGLIPWTFTDQSLDRSSASSAVGALIDWRLLGASRGVVYFAESSFGEESAIACNSDHSFGLGTNLLRSRIVSVQRWVRDLITFPQRRWLT